MLITSDFLYDYPVDLWVFVHIGSTFFLNSFLFVSSLTIIVVMIKIDFCGIGLSIPLFFF